jgi:hypothetical protein
LHCPLITQLVPFWIVQPRELKMAAAALNEVASYLHRFKQN